MTKPERDELRELEKAVYPAPWETRWDGTLGRANVFGPRDRDKHPPVQINISRPGYGNVAPEGRFIAAARNAIPSLLNRIDELEATVDSMLRDRSTPSAIENDLINQNSRLAQRVGRLEEALKECIAYRGDDGVEALIRARKVLEEP